MSKVLESLKHTVDAWRQDPAITSNRVPEYIQRQVVQLIPEYKVSYLAKYFGFGESTLSKWQRKFETTPQQPISEPQFIELASSPLAAEPQQQSLIHVYITRAGLEIKAELTCEQFQHLFMREETVLC